jgi:cell division protein FtsQ
MVSILSGLLIITYLLVVLGFVRNAHEGILCNGIEILIRDSLEQKFVVESDVREMLKLEYPKIAGIPLASIDAAGMEETLSTIPAIERVEVYRRVDGRLVVELFQRSPIVRVEDRDHRQYYLDREGHVIPAGAGYTPHLLMVNGEIDGHFAKQKNVLEDGTVPPASNIMKEVLALASFIADDPFWNAQVEQVYVDRNGEFELVPRVGAQIILFGDGSRLSEKFFKLETMYREGFRQKGWNQYEIINLKYNNQVICTKR